MEGMVGFVELHKGWKNSKAGFNVISKGMEWIYETQWNVRNKMDSMENKMEGIKGICQWRYKNQQLYSIRYNHRNWGSPWHSMESMEFFLVCRESMRCNRILEECFY